MEIQKTCNHPAFTAKFVPNKAFKEVVQWAEKNGQLRSLDNSLYLLSKSNKADIYINHGKTAEGVIYSNFTTGKRSVVNQVCETKSPAEASFDGIGELALLGRKFKSLIGKEVEYKVTPESIMRNYTV